MANGKSPQQCQLKPGDVYSAEVYDANVPAADWDPKAPAVPEGRVVRIETLFVLDLTTAAKTVRLGYDRGGSKIWLKRETLASGVYGLSLNRPLILVQGEKPAARIESATANDDCYFLARGVYL